MLKEVSAVLGMLAEVYEVFGLTYKLALSTRPEGFLGSLEQWDRAEAALTDALNQTGLDWEVTSRAHNDTQGQHQCCSQFQREKSE